MKKFEQELIAVRRAIHSNPELGNCEFKTSALLEKKLKGAGIKTYRIGKTGLVGLLEGKKSKSTKCVALRGDMDALPITEKTNKSYASKIKGVMHACGHDANSTMVLGAALLLAKDRNFSGSVKFIFQPNEESSGGAKAMVNGGVLSSPKPCGIIGIHVNPWIAFGKAGFKDGAMMASVDKFEIELIGTGGHGAYPHCSKDPVVACASLISALQTIVSRLVDPVEPVVLSIGKIEGGECFNVIPKSVKLLGTVRTLNEKIHKEIPKQIEKIVKGIALAYSLDYKFDYEVLGHALINDKKVLDLCYSSAQNTLGESNTIMLEKPSMGGEDFAEYLKEVPGCFVYIGSNGKQTYPWHHEKFDIDERVLGIGARLLAAMAKDCLLKL